MTESNTVHKTLVGVLGSGQIGYEPFDRRTWSGISHFVFTHLKENGALRRAFGVEVPRFSKYWLMLQNWNANGQLWRQQYYMSPDYRKRLTTVIKNRLQDEDFEHDFFVLGAMYDVPGLMHGQSRCFSYHDGNLAQSLKAPYSPRGLSARRIDEGLAFERKVYQGTDRIFAMSDYLRRSFVDDYNVPSERVSNVGAGINLEQIPEVVPAKRYDTKQILFIGADFERKGGQQLLNAFRHIHDSHPDATLHIVGPKRLVLSGEVSRGVKFYGFLDKTKPHHARTLRDLFEKCCLFALPSLYEPFGIAPLEAMAHQIPAVVSRGWALQEMVVPGLNGAYVEPGSVENLVDQFRVLLSDPDGLRRMGIEARRHVIERYTWPQVMRRIIHEIRQVQGNGNLGPDDITRHARRLDR